MAEALRLPDGRWVVPGNRWDLLDGRAPDTAPAVSVVVPYYDAQAQLDLVLTALALQTHPRTRLEVVVADDGSSTRPRVPDSVEGLDVRVVRQPDRGFRAAAARNLGARYSDGAVLCFLDADTLPEPEYVTRLTRLPALLPDALVTGRRRHAVLGGWTPAPLRAWLTDTGPAPEELEEPQWLVDLSAGGLRECDDSSYRAVISAVLACSRQLFTDVGGFDESFTSYGGEDWELAHRMFTAGAVLAHERSAVAWHDGPDWAGRAADRSGGLSPAAVAQKRTEALALAERVPEPAARAGHGWFPLPDIVVQVRGGAEEVAATVRSVLASRGVDLGVWTGAVELGWADVRVHAGTPPAEVLARCRTLVELAGGWVLQPAELHRLSEQVRPGGAGAVVDGSGGAGDRHLRVAASRAVRRAQRWHAAIGMPPEDLLGVLFGVRGRAELDGPR